MSDAKTEEREELGVNLFDPAVQQCPYDAYRTLRDQAPAYRQPGTNIYVITRYEDVRRVLLDPDWASTGLVHDVRLGLGSVPRRLTPPEVIARIGEVLSSGMFDADIAPRVNNMGVEPAAEPAAEFARFIQADFTRSEALLRLANFQPE